MSTPSSPPPGLVRRILASPPARVLLLGFMLLQMMGLNGDLMGSYGAEPVKAAQHIIAMAIAGFAVYVGHAHFVERRAADAGAAAVGRVDAGQQPAERRLAGP